MGESRRCVPGLDLGSENDLHSAVIFPAGIGKGFEDGINHGCHFGAISTENGGGLIYFMALILIRARYYL